MAKKLLFAFNPHAGRAAIKDHLLDIITTFVEAGYEVTVQTTRYAGELPHIIGEKAKDYDLLVTSGGDGTLNETINGLLTHGLQLPFGYIAAGTVNDFATTLRLSKNMPQAAQDIVGGVPYPCDAGMFQNKYFSYVAAFGAFTDVSYQTPQASKNLLGRAAYVFEALGRLPSIKSYHMRFEFDNEVIEDEFLFGMVSNSISVGGMPLNGRRDVSMNDGMLEVLLIKKLTIPFDVEAVSTSLLNLEINSPFFYAFKVSQLRVINLEEEDIPWTLDGEYGGSDRDITIRVCHQALHILVPPDAKVLAASAPPPPDALPEAATPAIPPAQPGQTDVL